MRHYCKEASHLVSDAFERELKFSERLRLRLHLLMCGMCRDHVSSINFMNKLFEKLRSQADEQGIILSTEQRDRISKALAEAAANPDE